MSRLPAHSRSESPPLMQFTPRDGELLQTIERFEGMLADYQIGKLFFPGVSMRTVRERLMKLYQNGYLERPTQRQRGQIPAMVYWVGSRGIEYLAGLRGDLPTASPTAPRWGLVEHDLLINDVRIAVLQAAEQIGAQVEQWVSSKAFWAQPDLVSYPSVDGQRTESRRVRPDGYAAIVYRQERARLLFEVDRSTEDNPRFVREKVIPGIAYLTSDVYRDRFGANSGRWLIITTSERRLANMKRLTEVAAKDQARLFYFTTVGQVTTENPLQSPIWRQGGAAGDSALLKAEEIRG